MLQRIQVEPVAPSETLPKSDPETVMKAQFLTTMAI